MSGRPRRAANGTSSSTVIRCAAMTTASSLAGRSQRYGIEQQAEIVRHAFLLRHGIRLPGVADPAAYDLLVNFPGAG